METDSGKHDSKNAPRRPVRIAIRLLIAVIFCSVVFSLSVWFSVTNSLPTNAIATFDPLLLLYLVPVYVSIAIASYVWRSRVMFIVSSLSVAALAPAAKVHVKHTASWLNEDFAAQNAMIAGFIVATACCIAVVGISRFMGFGQR